MRLLLSRTAAVALSVLVALGAAALPCAAGDSAAATGTRGLTRLSAASRQVLVTRTPADRLASLQRRTSESGQASPGTPSSFFKTPRGKVTLVLMGAGAGLTLWSIQHDRKPVKSPVR